MTTSINKSEEIMGTVCIPTVLVPRRIPTDLYIEVVICIKSFFINFLSFVAIRVFKSTPSDHNMDRHKLFFSLSSFFVKSFDATIPDITESQKFPE